MLELFLIQFGYKRKITLCYRSDVADTETKSTWFSLSVVFLLLLPSWVLSQSCRFFFLKVDLHSCGSDAPSIVFLVICHLETEFVGIVGACDTDLWLVYFNLTLGLVPRTVHTKRFDEPVWGTSRKDKILVPATRFCGKTASSGNLLQRLVPSCVPAFTDLLTFIWKYVFSKQLGCV